MDLQLINWKITNDQTFSNNSKSPFKWEDSHFTITDPIFFADSTLLLFHNSSQFNWLTTIEVYIEVLLWTQELIDFLLFRSKKVTFAVSVTWVGKVDLSLSIDCKPHHDTRTQSRWLIVSYRSLILCGVLTL